MPNLGQNETGKSSFEGFSRRVAGENLGHVISEGVPGQLLKDALLWNNAALFAATGHSATACLTCAKINAIFFFFSFAA